MTAYLVAILRSLRPHQWAKNALVLLPAVGAREPFSEVWLPMFFAVLTFSLLSSAVYVMNDVSDMQHDRLHPRKKGRPIASGAISLRAAVFLALSLAITSLGVAMWKLGSAFALVLAVYLVTALAYSLFFKRFALLDVFTLLALYGLRLVAGGVALAITLSPWLIAFSLFALLSIAFVKRFVEMSEKVGPHQEAGSGRGYFPADSALLSSLGVASGFTAGLVLALYVEDPRTQLLYSNPTLLWVAVPLWLYWICRLWLRAQRQRVNDDPLVSAITDWASYAVGVGALVAVMMAS